MKESFNTSFAITNKEGLNNLVTEVDHASERAIFNVIQKLSGSFYFERRIREIVTDSPYKWIIDPIDGTINYANGIPICCVSIAVE